MKVRRNRKRLLPSQVAVKPKPGVLIVEVSGKLSPPDKGEVYPTNLDFTNTATGQKFSAAIAKDQYSIQLPNHQSYYVFVTTGDQRDPVAVGTLVLHWAAKIALAFPPPAGGAGVG